MYGWTTICTVSRVKQFEMQGYYHATVEMYRDTSNRRNIQKHVGAMQEKYGRGGQKFKTYKIKKTEKGVGRQRNKRDTMRYVRNEGNERLATIDKQLLTLALRWREKRGEERWGKGGMNSDGQREEKKVRQRTTNDEKQWTWIDD